MADIDLPNVKKLPLIPKSLDDLESTIDRVSEAVAGLEGRLSGVLSNNPSTAEVALGGRDPEPGASNMALRLMELNLNVMRLEGRLLNIINQLEV